MGRPSRGSGTIALRLLVVLLLLGCPRIGSAAGTWSVLSLPQQPGEVLSPSAVAVDGGGNLYVADQSEGGRIQERDADGHWSVIASEGDAPGQVRAPSALAADAAGSLYVAEGGRIQKRDVKGRWSILDAGPSNVLAADNAGDIYAVQDNRIEERDAQGNWSVIATEGDALGQVLAPTALAVDTAGNLYVAEQDDDLHADHDRIQRRSAQGTWSVLAAKGYGYDAGQIDHPYGLAVDASGNLYAADLFCPEGCLGRIQKWDAQGHWSDVALVGIAPDQVASPGALAVDASGNLYVSEYGSFGPGGSPDQIQKRDTEGNWSVLATRGSAPGQIYFPTALAADAAGNLYAIDYNDRWRIQQRGTQGRWSLISTEGSPVGPVNIPSAVAADGAGNLYVAEAYGDGRDRLLKRDTQGTWSVIATAGSAVGQVNFAYGFAALATDPAGSLYVAQGYPNERIQRRDITGSWSVIATRGSDVGQVFGPARLAVDAGGSLYVANDGRILKRDAQGIWSIFDTSHTGALAADTADKLYVAGSSEGSGIQLRDAGASWSVIATQGTGLGQVYLSATLTATSGLALDGAGNLYVADTYNNRVQEYTPGQ